MGQVAHKLNSETNKPIQRLPVESVYEDELIKLAACDSDPAPPGWILSPLTVEKFILGDESLGIKSKFVASRELVRRVIISLATSRGAMLIGLPGTAKSWFSELLSAAISGSSEFIVQGGSITNIQQLLYSWNEAILKSLGPCREALIPTPLLSGFEQGKLVRFEEIARCAPDIQDGVLSLLSERQIVIPELSGSDRILYAQAGFNIVASSNTLDEGVHKMSNALKRRMNFEIIDPIKKPADEMQVVKRESTKLLLRSGVDLEISDEVIEALVTIFHELRFGQTLNGRSTDRLVSAVMSTAEAVSVAHALGVHAYYYRKGEVLAEDIVHFLIGATLKDNPDDRRRICHYFDTEITQKQGDIWERIYAFKHLL